MKPSYHPMKLSTQPLKAVMSWKRNTLDSKNFSTQGKSKQEALHALRLPAKPKTGPENYQWLQQLWSENQWSTFADFLKWYNDLDMTLMIQATENMNEFYKNICLDFIHQAISIPQCCHESVF